MLSEECINNQLIPADILKKNKFKSDWPFNKRKRHRCPHHRQPFDEDSEEDSYNILNQSDSSEDSDEMSEDEDISNPGGGHRVRGSSTPRHEHSSPKLN